MRRKIEIDLIEINVLENLLWTIGWLIFAFVFWNSQPTLIDAITMFFIFVVIDNLWNLLMWVISKLW